jgi:hypothetical protein
MSDVKRARTWAGVALSSRASFDSVLIFSNFFLKILLSFKTNMPQQKSKAYTFFPNMALHLISGVSSYLYATLIY